MVAPIVHGYSAYGNGKCRCPVCRAAYSAYCHQRRQRLRDFPLPPHVRHGTANAYWNYMCRCEACRAAIITWKAGRKAAS